MPRNTKAALALVALLAPSEAARAQAPAPIPQEAAEALQRARERPVASPAARPAAPIPMPGTLPGIDFSSPFGVPFVDTPQSLMGRAAVPPATATPPHTPPTPRGGAVEEAASPPAPAAQGGGDPAPCGTGANLADLLSPGCLDALRGGGRGAFVPSSRTFPPLQASEGVTCSVSISAGQPPAPVSATSFAAPDVTRCVESAVRLGFGVAGLTNIAVSVPGRGVLGISCFRMPDNVQAVQCREQPPAFPIR